MAENLKEVYEEYSQKFSQHDENEIIALTNKLLKAFNVYHDLKNVRKNVKSELEKGRDFLLVFVLLVAVFFLLNSFKDLRTLYT